MKRPNYVLDTISEGCLTRAVRVTTETLPKVAAGGDTPCPLLDELQQHKAKLREYLLLPDPENRHRVYVMHRRGNAFIAEVRRDGYGHTYTVESDFIRRSRIDRVTHSLRTMSTESLSKLVSFIKTLPILDDAEVAHIVYCSLKNDRHLGMHTSPGPFSFTPGYSESKYFASEVADLLAGVIEKTDMGVPVSTLDIDSIKTALEELGYYRAKQAYDTALERDTRLIGKTRVLMFEPPRFRDTGTVAFYTAGKPITYVNTVGAPEKIPQEVQALYATLAVNGSTDTVGVVGNWYRDAGTPDTAPNVAIMLVSDATVAALFSEDGAGAHNNADA